ncbi:MAG: DNA mismatch repair protein MutL [Enterobacterales bacterium]
MQPIKKLDVQLANQIAAGEVVERPASVVKELLENSLDAGAECVDIEISSGGTSLIRIRDDGSGIPKDQLKLAIAPHATSKIGSLDDLDVINSFGFRGEALASISSVSHFTLSSRTIDSTEGWQAEAQGSDREVKLTPVAVAKGTRIDVRELFFNTPARRRFLRTEKTEFNHIEEIVKKVALANFKVAISLKHNGRMIRRFRAAKDREQQEQRVAAVCGRQFMQRSVRLDLRHEDIEIKGWLALPDYHRSQIDGQFFYVNNRPVRDKVLNHAIRQAYQSFIPEGRVPAYVLYLCLDPRKVDVNVHPTKHEVRFHDARLIHDLLVQSIERGLAEGKELIDNECLEERLPQEFNTATFASTSHSNYAQSITDNRQHQAYRSLLQSVPTTSYQGINEQQSLSVPEINGWRFLTRLSIEFCLLENNQRLILLSVPLLLKQIKLQNIEQLSAVKGTSETKSQKLLFPEIINCRECSEAELIAQSLATLNIIARVNEKQITLLEVPLWLESLPIKEICLELSLIDNQELVNTYLLSNERAVLMLSLLQKCNDLSKLELKELPFKDLPGFFNQEFKTDE